ncbi:hypothetical protein Shyd_78180 [Streptomyces hydrogenans]|uniref:Iron-binding zinc finger CDGSH type domain-containing protein n=1 Tax=Streptomyces hydrogenans TaxID=1873719 RepID=A0ABQ3PN74_9ACTN|nr:CDGSH iron-sulfur domain-containing protein [Streptomyces hydrogenans]GHI26447.1 hypothetical protein Shyd_78180 [Streptomyces hydrogenans]
MEPVHEKTPGPASAAPPAVRPRHRSPGPPAPAPEPPPGPTAPPAVRITPLAEGPLLVEGPVEVVLADGTVRRSDRPVVALCRCRRSLLDPFCDTSHRRRVRAGRSGGPAPAEPA